LYLFKGKIKCGNCKGKFRGKSQRDKRVYICTNHSKDSSTCERFIVHEFDIIKVITAHFNSSVVDLDLIESIEAKSPTVKIRYTDGTQSVLSPNHYLV
jgi:hypothetical protein